MSNLTERADAFAAALEALRAKKKAKAGDTAFDIEGDAAIYIEAGIYPAIFLTWETRLLFGRAPKVLLWFEVTVPGMGAVKLARYFNVRRLKGPPRPRGGFAVGWYSDFLRTYVELFESPPRSDRLPLSRFFEQKHFSVEVVTALKDASKRELPAGARYSIIKNITKNITEAHTS